MAARGRGQFVPGCGRANPAHSLGCPGHAKEPISRCAEEHGPTQPKRVAPLPAADCHHLASSRERGEAREYRDGLDDQESCREQQQKVSQNGAPHPCP